MKITTAQQLSVFLKDTRHLQELSQAKLADLMGLRQGTISNFENNPETTKLETLFKILAALELQIEITPRHDGVKVRTSKGQTWDQEW